MIVEELESPCNTCVHEPYCSIKHPELDIPEDEKIGYCEKLNKFSRHINQTQHP